MTEDEQKRLSLTGRIEAKFATWNAEVRPILRDKIDKLQTSELEGLVAEIDIAKTLYNAQLMIGAAYVKSLEDAQARLKADDPPAAVT